MQRKPVEDIDPTGWVRAIEDIEGFHVPMSTVHYGSAHGGIAALRRMGSRAAILVFDLGTDELVHWEPPC